MQSRQKDLTVSIVTYNPGSMILQCLESIFSNPPPLEFEVHVVDNDSRDGTCALLQERFPQIHLVRNRKNVGYARANNQVILGSQSQYVLVLNPDITVLRGSLGRMVRYMEDHPDVGVAGCRLVYPDGRLQLSCRRFPTVTTFLLRGLHLDGLLRENRIMQAYLLEREDHRSDLEVDWCLGSCLLLRRRALDDVGPLDGRYFMYYEDIDLCQRMRLAGWKVAYIASAEMIHHYRRLSAAIPPNRYSLYHLKSAVHYFWKFRKERGLRTWI